MTDESSDMATGETEEPTANSNFAVLAAIADLDQDATPAAIAKAVGIAYSTVNPKLRAWETAGLAERFRNDSGQTLWRLTAAGRASTATPSEFTEAPEPDETDAPTGQATGSVAPPAATAPLSATSAETPDDGDPDEPPEQASAPAPADSDTSLAELATTHTPSSVDVDLSSDEKPRDDATVGDTAGPVDSGAPPDTATPAAETAEPDKGDADGGTTTAVAAPTKQRRPKGALRTSALAVLQANPDREYTIDDVKKQIDQDDADTGYPRASHGAVSNALDKLEADAAVERIDDRKATTFRLTPAAD